MKHKKREMITKIQTEIAIEKEPSIWHESAIWFAISFFPIILFMCALLTAIQLVFLE